MIKVFCDLHHTALFYSLQLLFENRLDGELYRPIGEEWYDNGYWMLYPGIHPHTVKQYLTLETSFKRDVHGFLLPPRMRLNEHYTVEDGIYYVFDPTTEKVQRAVTLEKFKDMKFDILISSVPSHIPLWNRLIQEYQPQAKHIFQVGNAWGYQPGVRNILSSTAPFPYPPGLNICFYHQEFDINSDAFSYVPPTTSKDVCSFIHYMREMELHHQYKEMLVPDGFTFMTYGAGMEGEIAYYKNVAKRYKETGWLWHVKPEADGYGYVIFNNFACGRPALIKANYYRGKMAEPLLVDQQTCIDISRYTVHEGCNLVRKLSHPDSHLRMCEAAYKRFTETCNFNWEFENKIKPFLERLA